MQNFLKFLKLSRTLINWNSNLKSVKEAREMFKNLSVLARGVKKLAHPKSVNKTWARFKNPPIPNLRKSHVRGSKNFPIPDLIKKHKRVPKICEFWQEGLKNFPIQNLWKKRMKGVQKLTHPKLEKEVWERFKEFAHPKSEKEAWEGLKKLSASASRVKKFTRLKSEKEKWEDFNNL